MPSAGKHGGRQSLGSLGPLAAWRLLHLAGRGSLLQPLSAATTPIKKPSCAQ